MVHNNVSLFDLCILLCNIFFEWYCRRIAPELAHMAPFTVEWRTKAHQRIEAHWFIFDSHGLLIWNLECSSVCFYPVTASWYWKQDWDRLQGKNVAEVHEFMRASEVLENSSTKQKLKTTPKKHKQNRKKKPLKQSSSPLICSSSGSFSGAQWSRSRWVWSRGVSRGSQAPRVPPPRVRRGRRVPPKRRGNHDPSERATTWKRGQAQTAWTKRTRRVAPGGFTKSHSRGRWGLEFKRVFF